jgi:chorismate synthase
MANVFGNILKISTFGESHGEAIGGVIDGFPSGVDIDLHFIQAELQRRKPGQSNITSQRKENDVVQILSGVFNGKTTGAPIGFVIQNTNAKSTDYDHLANTFRPSHADFTYAQKYGIRDYRGGGRSSARETANWVVAGAFAKIFWKKFNTKITAYVSQVGEICLNNNLPLDFAEIEQNSVRCPQKETASLMTEYIKKVRSEGDTIGGIVACKVQNVPPNLGEPVFNKLHAALGQAMLSINAAKGFEYGAGFSSAKMRGAQHNDKFVTHENKIKTVTNFSGGIQGGISNGEDIYFNVAFKPVATLMQPQQTVDHNGNEILLQGKGRHDPCVVPRAVPIVEALTAIVLLDFYLLNKAR